MNDSNIILNVNGIEVIYNHVILVLKGVSLQVPEGGVVALLGGNGSGKSTVIKVMADPAVRADPVPFYDELRERVTGAGPLIRCRVSYVTIDHGLAQELLRSDDFRVIKLGSNLPGPLRRLEERTRPQALHPLRPPSLLAVEPPEHTRYRKTVSSVFTARAVAALRERVQDTAEALLDEMAGAGDGSRVVDVVDRYCSQLPVTVISAMAPRLGRVASIMSWSSSSGMSTPDSRWSSIRNGCDRAMAVIAVLISSSPRIRPMKNIRPTTTVAMIASRLPRPSS